MFRSDTRGRITIVEIVTSVFALGFVAALWPVVQGALEANIGQLSTGTAYLIQLLLPLMLLVMLTVLFVTATAGGGR